MVWVLLAMLLVGPVLMMKGVIELSRILDWIDEGWRRVRRQQPPRATGVPVQKLAADLRRISEHLEQVDRTDPPAKAFRLRAATLAYDGVLLSAARTLEVPAPDKPPLESIERLETEAALAQHGLVW